MKLTPKQLAVLKALATDAPLQSESALLQVLARNGTPFKLAGLKSVLRSLVAKNLIHNGTPSSWVQGHNGLTEHGVAVLRSLREQPEQPNEPSAQPPAQRPRIERPHPSATRPPPAASQLEIILSRPPSAQPPKKPRRTMSQIIEGVDNKVAGCGLVTVLVLLIALIGGCNSIEYVRSGEIGVRTSMGQLDDKMYANDWYLILPWQDLHQINVQERSLIYERPVTSPDAAVSFDTQTVGFSLQVSWQPDPTKVLLLYRNFQSAGDANAIPEAWGKAIIEPVLPQGLKSVIARNTLRTIFRERDRVRHEVATEVRKLLEEKLSSRDPNLKDAIRINQVIITSLDYSDEFEKAIEATQLAEQRVLEQRNQLTQRRVQEAQKIVEAEAQQQADVARAQGAALSKLIDFEAELTRLANLVRLGVNPNLMYQWDRVADLAKKWNGQLPHFMNGEGGFSFAMPADMAAGERKFDERELLLMLEDVRERRARLEQQITESRQLLQDAREQLLEDTARSSAGRDDDSRGDENGATQTQPKR